MTEREQAIKHFEWLKLILSEKFKEICPEDSIAYKAAQQEGRFYDMAISDLSAKEPKNGERFSCPNCGFKADWHIPEREKGEWIPVSERLPETNKWVLVSVESSSGNHYIEIMRIDKYKGLWTDNIDYYAEIVKAWQPLPEPYKEGGE